MKIPASIREIYANAYDKSGALKKIVDGALRDRSQNWHYASRIKTLESFALKLETGRVKNPRLLEDLFACTLVVENYAEVENAVSVVEEFFEVVYRRPKTADRTHKRPSVFDFDDLRLYARVKVDPSAPVNNLVKGVIFEVQIKTFLQHAWAIATHDLVYKTDAVSWSKERVAFQVKAMLEHAELAITEADKLSTSGLIAASDDQTRQLVEYMEIVREHWEVGELPADVRRLAENVRALCNDIGISAGRLQDILLQEKLANGGKHPSNISPYAAVTQYMLANEIEKVRQFCSKADADRHWRKIVVPKEIEFNGDPAIFALPGIMRLSADSLV